VLFPSRHVETIMQALLQGDPSPQLPFFLFPPLPSLSLIFAFFLSPPLLSLPLHFSSLCSSSLLFTPFLFPPPFVLQRIVIFSWINLMFFALSEICRRRQTFGRWVAPTLTITSNFLIVLIDENPLIVGFLIDVV
jgi:hypothetical protein